MYLREDQQIFSSKMLRNSEDSKVHIEIHECMAATFLFYNELKVKLTVECIFGTLRLINGYDHPTF